jgi:hypothetical protein
MRGTLKKASVAELSSMYEEAATTQWQELQAANAKAANAQYKRVVSIWKELRSRGKEGQAALSMLMASSNPHVRVWAASHVLEFDPGPAEAELARLADGPPSIVRLDAEMTLKQWRAGKLKFEG